MQRCQNGHFKSKDQFININNKPTKVCRDCRDISHFHYFCVVKDKNIIKVEHQKRTKKIKKLNSLSLHVTFD
jgi:hypothetical protein